MDGWCGGRFQEVGDLKMVAGRQVWTVVEGSAGGRGSLWAVVILMMTLHTGSPSFDPVRQ